MTKRILFGDYYYICFEYKLEAIYIYLIFIKMKFESRIIEIYSIF